MSVKLVNRTRPARGFSLVELMVSLAIIAALVTLGAMTYRKYIGKAEFTQCKTKIRALGLRLQSYYDDHDYVWPQAPEEADDEEYTKFFHDLLMGKDKYDGVSQEWLCPAHDRELKKEYAGKENERPKWEASYAPIDFDDKPGGPREDYMPWILETYGHEEGHNIYMSDGSVTTFQDKPLQIIKKMKTE